MRSPLSLLVCFLTLYVHAQSTLGGKLTDDSGEPVAAASIALSNPEDSSLLAFTISKGNGSFRFSKVDRGRYLLVVAAYGHDVLYQPVHLDTSDQNLELQLRRSSISLEAVMVQARHIPILFQKDTVIYNVASVKLGANATVEDLLRKLPGLQVGADGSLVFEGQTIGRVLVNGNEFFGGNVHAATRNLDAALVDKVEVIDRKNDEDDFTNSEGQEREKVINLVLKKDVERGIFGSLRASYGSKGYYDGKGNVHLFSNSTQLSVIGGANTMDEDLFDWGDARTLQNYSINPFDDWQSMTWSSSGLESPSAIGINLHSESGKAFKSDVSYVLNHTTSKALDQRYSEVYLPGRSVYASSESEVLDRFTTHQLSSQMVFTPDTVHRLSLRLQYKSNQQTADESMLQNTRLPAGSILNSGVRRSGEQGFKNSLEGKLSYVRNSRIRKGDFLILTAYAGLVDLNDLTSIHSATQDGMLLPLPQAGDWLLSKDLGSQQENVAATLNYNFAFGERFSLRPGINWKQGAYKHDFTWTPSGEVAVAELSPSGGIDLTQWEYLIFMHWKMDSFTDIWFTPKLTQIVEDRNFETDTAYGYAYNRFYPTPSLFINSGKNQVYRLNIGIYGNLNQPGIERLLPIVDTTQPYMTRLGNIRLQNYMSYYGYINYTHYLGLDHFVSMYSWNGLRVNPIGTESQLDENNFSISLPVNLRNSVNSSNSLSYRFPVKVIAGQLGVGIQRNYSRDYSSINNSEVESEQSAWSANLVLAFNRSEWWGFDLTYNQGRSTGRINGSDNNPFSTRSVESEFRLDLWDRWSTLTEFSWEMYGGNELFEAQSIPIWNIESDLTLGPTKQWSIGLKAYDILDRSTDLYRYWSPNSFVESRSNVITRYLLLRLTYKIKKAASESESID